MSGETWHGRVGRVVLGYGTVRQSRLGRSSCVLARLVTSGLGTARQSRHDALGLGSAGHGGAQHGKFRRVVAGGGL